MEEWKIRRDRQKCDQPGCPLAGEKEFYAILQLPECIRIERCQNCFAELQRAGRPMPFHWKIRRIDHGKQQSVLDLESLRQLFDSLGSVDTASDTTSEAASGEATSGEADTSARDDAATAQGLRYMVALLLLRKRRLKMVDPRNAAEEAASLLVVDPKIAEMEPVALHAPELTEERLAGLRDELMAALGG